jgi:PAS domain S-box-containing protein
VTGRLISLRDVTDRKRGEESLRASEARFRALFEHAPDAYFLTDREARFVDANRAAERLTGYRREELLGRSFQDLHLLAPGDLERVGALLGRDAAARPSGPAEFALTRADGTRLVIEITTSLLGLADRALVLGIARDLTARRRTEDALRESEERYRNLVENVEELICTHDMDGRLLTVNRALVTTMGHERPEDLVGRSLEEFLAPDVRHHFPGYLAALRRDGA